MTRSYSPGDPPDAPGSPEQISSFDSTLPDPARPRCVSPVALCLFNRPETTAQVMRAIRAVRPPKLYLIADGARTNHADDSARCRAARQVALNVDWECEIHTNFSETNLGLKRRIETGMNWLFENVPEAIILEDDCVPDPTFFHFCDALLERYRADERIMTISGCDYKFGAADDRYSYTFSRYPLIWGWATWRRAWLMNDPDMTTLPDALRTNRLRDRFADRHAAQYWSYVLNDNRQTQSSWDYAWLWSIWEHDGLCIHPNTNLVENIGFGKDATHTHDPASPFANMPAVPLHALRHPPRVERNADADALIEQLAFSGSVRRLWDTLRARRVAQARSMTGSANPGNGGNNA